MYIPASFTVVEPAKLRDFIDRHGFATLISSHDGQPDASHLPLMTDLDAGEPGRLVGHMARANPQWRSAAGKEVLAIFHGPHAYISPSWAEEPNMVPTWNYVTVHAHGKFLLVEDQSRLREILRRIVHRYESNQISPWSIDAPEPEYVEKLLGAIVGFEIEITRLEGKWKLSQNYPFQRRAKIAKGLQATRGHEESRIAELMLSQEAISQPPFGPS